MATENAKRAASSFIRTRGNFLADGL